MVCSCIALRPWFLADACMLAVIMPLQVRLQLNMNRQVRRSQAREQRLRRAVLVVHVDVQVHDAAPSCVERSWSAVFFGSGRRQLPPHVHQRHTLAAGQLLCANSMHFLSLFCWYVVSLVPLDVRRRTPDGRPHFFQEIDCSVR